MAQSFTLDTNCLIALENNEPASPAVREIVVAHEQGKVDVAVVAISASERQRDKPQLENFSEFQDRLAALDLRAVSILPTISYWGLSFWDRCIWADEELVAFEKQIHEVLFPTTPFSWSDFCAANGLDVETSLQGSKWRNHKCDVLALWSHIHASRDVFVTDDDNFHKTEKKSALIRLGAGRIERATMAATLL